MLQREWEHSSRPHRRQGKHGHAANTQGARSPACCGESPRAFGQRVSLGDQRLAPEACSEALRGAVCLGAGHLQQHSYAVSTRHGCQLNGAHSPHASSRDVCYEAATTTYIVQMLLGLFMALQLQTSAAGSTFGIHIIATAQEAGEARPRSQHTGSSLPSMLRGKSLCLWAESVIGRPKASA